MPIFSKLVSPHIAKLHGYAPGLQPSGHGWIKLNTNESGYPPSPSVAEALLAEIGREGASLRLYPNPTSEPLRGEIASYHGCGLTAGNVLVGNGSDDVLNLLVRCFSSPTVDTGFTLPSYSLYPVLVGMQDGRSHAIEFDRSMQLPVEAIVSSGASAFFLTSPNAPTGVAFSNADLERILSRFSGVLVVDEAYAPFAKENAVPLLARYTRLVVVRTLSKAHALAGIRVGYALANPEMVDLLDRVRDSYNVSRLSQVAARAALTDRTYYDKLISRVVSTRDRYRSKWIRDYGWFIYESAANFLFVEPRNRAGLYGRDIAKSVYDFLFARRILVRAFPNHPLTGSFLRISVGTDEEMVLVDQALFEWTRSEKQP
ncbi:MAG: aminotransferase class I/II-fold pyridoxal phosphate-dependent enzyme [Opitutaceae bacterium]|nr:aminotransferase class I/II-fold pyridoxal phosphate-dependent enzyme [Opitutaceae bacterium]